jgi:hypothetical protein
MKVPGLHGDVHTFEKPWFTTWESAAALWVSLLVFWSLKLWEYWKKQKSGARPSEQQPLLNGEHDHDNPDTSHQVAHADPADKQRHLECHQSPPPPPGAGPAPCVHV